MSNLRVLLAPDSFKGSLSAPEVARALAEGIANTNAQAECIRHPLADGGEGTLDVLVAAGFGLVQVNSVDSKAGDIIAHVARRDDIVAVESAQAAGFDPGATPVDALMASSAGVGMMISSALDMPISSLYLAVGGSATTDGGAGMLHALGATFWDGETQIIPTGGGSLAEIRSVEWGGLHPRLREVSVTVLTDVDNPLLGRNGAARIFGPQKGADSQGVELLEKGLHHFAQIVGPAHAVAPGSGSGGGIGFAALAALGATWVPGARAIMGITGFDSALESVSLVITGEGSFDDQSTRGKVPSVVIDAALARGIPVVVVCGVDKRSATSVTATPALSVYSLLDIEPDVNRCIDNAYELLGQVGQEIGRTI